jgi:hypothetical protein
MAIPMVCELAPRDRRPYTGIIRLDTKMCQVDIFVVPIDAALLARGSLQGALS